MTSTFDFTFDQTFQGLVINENPPVETGCRKPGVYLGWLADTGRCFWLFTGNRDDDQVVSAPAPFKQGGLQRYAWKEESQSMLLRTDNLDRQTAEVVKSVRKSPWVVVLAPDESGKFHQVPVAIDPGTFAVWRESENRIGLEVRIVLPSRRTQRIGFLNQQPTGILLP